MGSTRDVTHLSLVLSVVRVDLHRDSELEQFLMLMPVSFNVNIDSRNPRPEDPHEFHRGGINTSVCVDFNSIMLHNNVAH